MLDVARRFYKLSPPRRLPLAAVAACFAAILGACGGGGGSTEPEPPRLPDNARVYSGATVYVDKQNAPTFAALSAPNPSDGKDYKTTEFMRNYGLERIRAEVAYQRGYFGQGVTVAVFDSAVYAHEEMRGQFVPGWNFADNSTVAVDKKFLPSHGVAVAGVIAAVWNDKGTHGVAPMAKVMPLAHNIGFIGRKENRAQSKDLSAFRFAAERNVPIINNSFGTTETLLFTHGGTMSLMFYIAPMEPEVMPPEWLRGYQEYISQLSVILEGKDIAMVWSAGNGGWNSENGGFAWDVTDGVFGVSVQLSRAQREFLADAANNGVTVRVCRNVAYDCDIPVVFPASLSLNRTAMEKTAPLYEPSLRGKWIVAVATDENDVIGSFSDGCGRAMHWCLAAPGKDILLLRSLSYRSGNIAIDEMPYRVDFGTSFAAPHVSGALAVLRSRFPDMPMRAILAILFKTAKDKGAEGVDPVYGHGLLDLGAAITVQGGVELAIPSSSGGGSSGSGGMASVPLSGMSGARLSPGFSRLHRELSGLSLAVSYLGGAYYYDAPLSSLLEVERRRASLSGMAAADMLMSERRAELGGAFRAVLDGRTGGLSRVSYGGDAWRLAWRLGDDAAPLSWMEEEAVLGWTPFMEVGRSALASWELLGGWTAFSAIGAGAGGYRQHGLRWRSGELSSGWGFWAEGSRLTEEGGFLGNRGDALGVSGSRTDWGRWGFFGEFGGWRWRGEHGYGRTAATVGEVGLIESATGLGYSVWRLEGGMSDALSSGDELRLGVEGSPRARGRIRLRYARSSGEVFVEEFQYALPMRAELETRELGELGESGVTWRMGYKWSPGRGALAALGLEYATGGDMSEGGAASFRLRWVF